MRRSLVSTGLLLALLLLAHRDLPSSRAAGEETPDEKQKTGGNATDEDALIRDLSGDDVHIRLAAIIKLERLRTKAASAVPALIVAFEDESELIANSAVDAIVKMGPIAVPDLITALDNPSAGVRTKVAEAVGRIGSKAAKARLALEKAAKDADNPPALRCEALRALGEIQDDAAIPALAYVLASNADETVRTRAAAALGQYGRKAKAALPALLGILQTFALDKRVSPLERSAEYAVAMIGSDALPDLLKIVETEDNQAPVLRAMRWMAKDDQKCEMRDVVPVLVRLARDDELDSSLRLDTIETLGTIGNRAAAAVPDLEKLLSHKNADIRLRTAESLTEVDPTNKKVVSALIDLLSDSDIRRRTDAAVALGRCKSSTDESVPALCRALGDEREEVRLQAVQSLGHIGKPASAALADLKKLLKENLSFVMRHATEQAIKHIEMEGER